MYSAPLDTEPSNAWMPQATERISPLVGILIASYDSCFRPTLNLFIDFLEIYDYFGKGIFHPLSIPMP